MEHEERERLVIAFTEVQEGVKKLHANLQDALHLFKSLDTTDSPIIRYYVNEVIEQLMQLENTEWFAIRNIEKIEKALNGVEAVDPLYLDRVR